MAGNQASTRRERASFAGCKEPLHHGSARVQAIPPGSHEYAQGSVAKQPGSSQPRSSEQDLYPVHGGDVNADDRSRSTVKLLQVSLSGAVAEDGNAAKREASSLRAKLSGCT